MQDDNIVKLFDGIYFYFNRGVNYSQENFYVVYDQEHERYRFTSEILSRVQTGEFFKIITVYELNYYFAPLNLTINRYLGDKHSEEEYRIDTSNQLIEYRFSNGTTHQNFTRPISSKHQLQSPAFCTSCIFLQNKKLDQMAKTPITFITCQNEWEYIAPPEDKVLFAEFKTHDVNDFKINGVNVAASQVNLFQSSSLMGSSEEPTIFYISKNLGIPYMMESPDGIKIVIQKLRKLKQEDIKI